METEQVQSSDSAPTPTPAAVVFQPVNEATTETQTAEVSRETPEAETAKPNGYQGESFVEFTPEQQKRVNALTKKISKLEQGTSEWQTVAKQQYDLINELRNGQQQIVNHLQTSNYADAESQLKSQRREALNRGDWDAVDAANDKLTEIKIAKRTAELQGKNQPIKPVAPPISAADPVELAVQQGAMSRADADAYHAWVNETDANGNPVRPWTNMQDARAAAAGAYGKAVFSDQRYANKPFAEKLKEIDRSMGLANRPQQQGVMPAGNLTGNSKVSNIKLSPQAESLAVRTKFAGSNKTNADHIEAYRKQVAEVRGAKR